MEAASKDLRKALSEKWIICHDRGMLCLQYRDNVTLLGAYGFAPRIEGTPEEEYVAEHGYKGRYMVAVQMVPRLSDEVLRQYRKMLSELHQKTIGEIKGKEEFVESLKFHASFRGLPMYHDERRSFYVYETPGAEVVKPDAVVGEIKRIFSYFESRLSVYKWR